MEATFLAQETAEGITIAVRVAMDEDDDEGEDLTPPCPSHEVAREEWERINHLVWETVSSITLLTYDLE